MKLCKKITLAVLLTVSLMLCSSCGSIENVFQDDDVTVQQTVEESKGDPVTNAPASVTQSTAAVPKTEPTTTPTTAPTTKPYVPPTTERSKERPMADYIGMTVGDVKAIFGNNYYRDGWIDMYSQYIGYHNGETQYEFYYDIPYYVDSEEAWNYNHDDLIIYSVKYHPSSADKTNIVMGNWDANFTYGELYGGVLEEDVPPYEYCYTIEMPNDTYITYYYEEYPLSDSLADEVSVFSSVYH